MHRTAPSALALAALLALPSPARAGEPPAPPVTVTAPGADWLTGEGVSLGGVLFPHVHLQSVYGRTSSALGHELGAGHHDPVEDGWTHQGLELGLSGRWSDHFETFVAWHGYWGNEAPHDFDHEFEEYYAKLRHLPGGLELRAGRFLNRLGLHNPTHLHGWDWADNYLVSGRFLGDDGLYTRGAELSWQLPVKWTSVLSLSAGQARAEAHGHSGEEEEAEAPGHALFEAEGAAFDATLYTLNWTTLWEINDFHSLRGGLSWAWGDNTWDRPTTVLGAHLEYAWQQNGASPGGHTFRWRTEVLYRHVSALADHHDEEDAAPAAAEEPPHAGSFGEWGLYTSLVYGMDLPRGFLEAGLRAEWVEGAPLAGLPSRTRLSPALTYYVNDHRNAWLRLQYNRDHIEHHGSEDSLWLGLGLNWGGGEVR